MNNLELEMPYRGKQQ